VCNFIFFNEELLVMELSLEIIMQMMNHIYLAFLGHDGECVSVSVDDMVPKLLPTSNIVSK
jgi:hypothetical protein